MEIREAIAEDLESILEVFEGTIENVNSKDYSKEQISIWMSTKDRDIWLQKIAVQSFYVATIENEIVGFSSIDSDGYLDFMYVHHKFQQQGIANSLLKTIENTAKDANLQRIWTSASITARPFFSKRGFIHFEDEHKMLSGVHFKNALMEKKLSD